MSKRILIAISIVLSALMGSWAMAMDDSGGASILGRDGGGGRGDGGGDRHGGGGRGDGRGDGGGRHGGGHGGGHHGGGHWGGGNHGGGNHGGGNHGCRRRGCGHNGGGNHGGGNWGGNHRNDVWSCAYVGKNRRGVRVTVRSGSYWNLNSARSNGYNRCVNNGLRSCKLVACVRY